MCCPRKQTSRKATVFRLIKYRLRWAGHVARMKEGNSVFKLLTGDLYEGLGLDERTMLECNLHK